MKDEDEDEQSSLRWGYVMTLGAAVGFSLKAVLIRLALAEGVDVLTLLMMRMYAAAPLLLGALIWSLHRRKEQRPQSQPVSGPTAPGRSKVRLAARYLFMALVGTGGAMYLSFYSIARTGAAIATLIIYTYPAM